MKTDPRPQIIDRRKNKPAPVKGRIFRAIWACHFFTSKEISILSGAKMQLVKKLIWELRREGDIEQTGTRNLAPRGREYVYRLRDRDGFYLRHVRRL